MRATGNPHVVSALGVVLGACLLAAGCQTCPTGAVSSPSAGDAVPREMSKITQPAYIIEPPDLLVIDALRVVPRPPLKLDALDVVFVTGVNVLPSEPINGPYSVTPEGNLDLGPTYGVVPVLGLTLEQARAAVQKHLREVLGSDKPEAHVTLAQSKGMQQIRGDHLVRPDGTVGLGIYGSVYVTGLTLDQARAAIEEHLSQFLLNPQVSVDVGAYNSKSYYIVMSGGGNGEQVLSFPHTGNETVLDAMSQPRVSGLPVMASLHRIWVARPAPADANCYQILPVDWQALTRGAATATNYQLLPGDRIFVDADPLFAMNTTLTRVFSPLEQVFGTILLGAGVVQTISVPFGTGTGGIR
jgi:polysaccharide export outer membrane protein